MKRYVVSMAGSLLLVAVLAVFAPSVGARAAFTRRATAGSTISGVVVNASHQNATLAGQTVTLQRGAGGATQDIATTVSGPDGHFAFTHVAGAASDSFAVYTEFQGGMFPSQVVNLGTDAATSLQLRVYDTTNDDAHLKVTVATMLVRQPRPVNGLIGIGEIVSIENSGATAFVGMPTGDASKPMRLLRFATPPDASNLSLGIGFAGSQIITTDKGFGSTATVPPGTTDFAFGFDIPYAGTSADLSYRAVYPTARVVALVAPDVFVSGRDFAAQGIVDSLGLRYQVFTVANTTPGSQVALQLTGLPQAGEKTYLDGRALTIFAMILALLALLALLIYALRGNIAVALRLVPASAPAVRPSQISQDASDEQPGECDQLLQQLLTLERSHAAGKIDDARFRQQDRQLRLQLRNVLASEQPTTAVSAPGSEATAAPSSDSDAGGEPHDDSAARETASEQSSGGRR